MRRCRRNILRDFQSNVDFNTVNINLMAVWFDVYPCYTSNTSTSNQSTILVIDSDKISVKSSPASQTSKDHRPFPTIGLFRYLCLLNISMTSLSNLSCRLYWDTSGCIWGLISRQERRQQLGPTTFSPLVSVFTNWWLAKFPLIKIQYRQHFHCLIEIGLADWKIGRCLIFFWATNTPWNYWEPWCPSFKRDLCQMRFDKIELGRQSVGWFLGFWAIHPHQCPLWTDGWTK